MTEVKGSKLWSSGIYSFSFDWHTIGHTFGSLSHEYLCQYVDIIYKFDEKAELLTQFIDAEFGNDGINAKKVDG